MDGEPRDFEWKIFPEAKALDILHKIQADQQGKHITPENFSDRIIFMTMFNDIVLEMKNDEDSCALTSRKIKESASKFTDGQCSTAHDKQGGLVKQGKAYQDPVLVAPGGGAQQHADGGEDPSETNSSDLGTKHLTSERSEMLMKLVNCFYV